MKPTDVKLNTYVASSKKIINKNPKFETDDIVRISKYKNNLQNFTLQIDLKRLCD